MQVSSGIPGAFQNGRKFPEGKTGRRYEPQLMSQISRGYKHTQTQKQMLKNMESKCRNNHQMKAAFFPPAVWMANNCNGIGQRDKGKDRISTEGEVLPRHPTDGKLVHNERCSSFFSSPSFLHSLLLMPVHPSSWQK